MKENKMGIKSRGNWRINCCIKFECTNRDRECEKCIKFNKYNTALYGLRGNLGLLGIKDSIKGAK
jgi:hypothetical protein